MAKTTLIRVGPHKANVSGRTAKAYVVKPEGNEVKVKWGGVEVKGVAGKDLTWRTEPRTQTHAFDSKKEAGKAAKALIESKIKYRGYQELPKPSKRSK